MQDPTTHRRIQERDGLGFNLQGADESGGYRIDMYVYIRGSLANSKHDHSGK